MLFVWLVTLGIGIANACVVSSTHGHTESVQHAQVASHSEVNEAISNSDEVICLTVCTAEQTAVFKVKQVDNVVDASLALISQAPVLTVAVVDLDDHAAPSAVPTWREPPVSIRFLRLTI